MIQIHVVVNKAPGMGGNNLHGEGGVPVKSPKDVGYQMPTLNRHPTII